MSYFPAWYYPGGATLVPSPGEADDLLTAIRDHFRAQPELGVITGGIFLDQAGDRSEPPYVVVEELGASLDFKSSTSTVHDTRIRFTVYAHDLDQAGTFGNLIAEAFNGRPFEWVGGRSSPMVRHERKHQKDKGRAPGAVKVWHMRLDFQTRVRRTS